jgi:hypothetical protein
VISFDRQRRRKEMASEVIQSTHYIGTVLPNGHLEIPETIIEQMGLKHGDEVENQTFL